MTFLRKTSTKKLTVLIILGLSFVVFGNFLLVRGNLNDGLVGYWNFDNNGFDQTVNGNDAVMTDILFVPSRFGDGVYTNGVSSKVVVDSLIVANESYTVSLWVKNLGNPSTSFIWCGYSSSAPSFEGNNGGYSYYVNNNNNINSGVLTNSVWYNFVFSWDNQTKEMCLYKNAVLVGSNTESFTVDFQVINLGAHRQDLYYFKGVIDDVRVYNRVLSLSDIQALYVYDPLVTPSPSPAPTSTVTNDIFAGIAILMFMIIIGFLLSIKPYSIINIVYGILVLSVTAGLLLGGYLAGLWFFAFAGVAVGLICLLRGTDLL